MQSQNAFVSPVQTPQGSPSKNKMPPGAFDLPDVFSNAMKLLPTMGSSPSKTSKQQHISPSKSSGDDVFGLPDYNTGIPGSPTRQSNKENTQPGSPTRPQVQKEQSFLTQAAGLRQDPYRTRGEADRPSSPTRRGYINQGGLTAEDMEKLNKQSVKRLANVTQLCRSKVNVRRLRVLI